MDGRHSLLDLSLQRRWLLASLLFVGCRGNGPFSGRCESITPGSVPVTAGTYNATWQAAQQARADADSYVFYRYEWQNDGDQLGPFGQRHLVGLIRKIDAPPSAIVIEPSGDSELDDRRVSAIKGALAALDSAWAEHPVVVDYPAAEPMYGFESPRVTRGFSGGVGGQNSGQGGGGFGGGMGGAGGGMGGLGGGAGNLGGGMF